MKKIVVVGAGISGLSAAIYAQRSGFDVTICEQSSMPGGICTSWKRKGYLFEGAVHWLTGSSPKTEIYQLWKETGALNDKVKMFLTDPFYSVDHNGEILSLFRDIEKTIEHLGEISPNDRKMLQRLKKEVKSFSHMEMLVSDIRGVKAENPKHLKIGSLLKMLPALPGMPRLCNMSNGDYVEQFEHPGIKRLLRIIPDYFSAVCLISTLAMLNMGDGGYPEGGSLAMISRMTENFKNPGGKLLLNTRVKKVNVKNGAVTGVTLEDETFSADAVIVTQETIAAIDQLFDISLNDSWVTELRKKTKPAVCTFIGVGIRTVIPQTPIPVWLPEEPITYAGNVEPELIICNYAGYEGYAPKGCSALTTAFMGDTYDFWKKAKENGSYEAEKKALADQISKAICRKYPQANGNIEVVDIATPLTYERYTGAHHGSWMGIIGPGDKMKTYPGYLKNAKGVYFAGHRMMPPGGLPVAVFTGRQAAQMVCRQFGEVFR